MRLKGKKRAEFKRENQKSIEEYTNLRIMLCRNYEELRREVQSEEDGEEVYGSFLYSMATMIDFIGAILTTKLDI